LSKFKLLLQSCGLSISEAAVFLNVREPSVKDWSSDRRTVPDGIIKLLLELSDKQKNVAQKALTEIEKIIDKSGIPENLELGLATDDHEAQTLGWPCVGAHGAVLRRIIEMLPSKVAASVVIVPRGSTSSTAAAIRPV